MYISAGINGEEFYNLLLENEQFQKNFSIAKANEVKELFGTFQKDMAMGLINFTMDNAPTFLMYASVKSATPVQLLYEKKNELGLKRGEDILKLGENEYVYKSRMLNIFFGVRNNSLYATNDEMLYKSIDKTVNPSIKDTEFASNIKGKNGAFVINTEAVLALPIVKMLSEYGGSQYATAFALVDKIAYVEATGNSNNDAAERQKCKCIETDRKLHQRVCRHLIPINNGNHSSEANTSPSVCRPGCHHIRRVASRPCATKRRALSDRSCFRHR